MNVDHQKLSELSKQAWTIAYLRALSELRPEEAEKIAQEAVTRLKNNFLYGDSDQDERYAELCARQHAAHRSNRASIEAG
ncbi:hypothetical protein ACQR53_11905 [Xanthomonas oryzae]|uniref:hypothetical protein n=1 Tax=Xanthomonas TaxID=338 RepID=UPI0001CBF007|nr:hypothetical protein [Xanthomonas vasicola]MBV6748414.1 hypothetical protein [Xanthomonas vasicola pv. vasculorum NCPPB 890]MBV6894051.1 hypothetical protein [Xanthomonas vasicola pv. vasculorum]MDO6949906.1 hypothetical protein [Xanthomonas vasicola]MDO6961930.1 hypothetical protein [Xanthomonas vasicola]MDO6970856.1 hypothetical protein [Xanthomonas vasicola]